VVESLLTLASVIYSMVVSMADTVMPMRDYGSLERNRFILTLVVCVSAIRQIHAMGRANSEGYRCAEY